jgi:uncharacterized small protein (DUF1192 family)
LGVANGGTGANSLDVLGFIPIGGSKKIAGTLAPNNGSCDLGSSDSSSTKWKDGYFSGQVKAGSFNASSDERLKDNIAPCQVKDISQVTVKEYDKQGIDGRQVGVIAQELREQFPELVSESNDEMKTLGVDICGVIYYLMDEVKRLKAELREKKMID